jgi:hypothetical protein
MAQIVKLRRSSVSGQKPTNSNLQLGELALNTTDGKVYMAKSGSLGPSVEELISTNTVNTGSIYITDNITASYFTGSFIGDGSGLTNIPYSGVTGLELNKITSGSVSASISPNRGLEINTDTTITGSFTVSGSTTQIGNNTLLGTTLLSGSITISGSLDPAIPSIRIFGDTQTDGVIRFDPVSKNIDNSISASYLFVSSSTNDLYFSQNGNGYNNVTRLRWLEGNMYTGLLHGGNITATNGGTTFNISKGSGIIVNLNASLTDDPYPTTKLIEWSDFTGQTLTYRTTHIQTFIGINDDGEIHQQTGAFNDGQYNSIITLGTVIHQNLSTVNASITYPNVAYGYKQRTYDFFKAFGALKLSGLDMVPTGSLGLNVGSGTAWADGRNYQNDPNNPSYIIDPGTAVSKIFRYYQVSGTTFVQDTNNGAGYTTIDPTKYVNNGVLESVGGDYTIQRVFWYPNSATKGIVVYYGNDTYGTIREAIDNISIERFIEIENTKQNAIYLGSIIIAGNGDFTNTNKYSLVPAGLFRNVGGNGGGGSIPTSRLADLSDVDILSTQDNDLLVYNVDTLKWESKKSLEGDYTITGSLNVSGSVSGSFTGDGSGLTNLSNITGSIGQVAILDSDKTVTSSWFTYVNNQTFGLGTNAYTLDDPERLMVDNYNSINIATFQTSQDETYAQVNVKNFGSGSASSADFVIWNDVTTEELNYVDLGLNSSNYTDGFLGYENDGYLYSHANDLYVGSYSTGSHGHLHLFAGGNWDNSAISIYSDNTIGINVETGGNVTSTIPSSIDGFAVEISGSVKFRNDITVLGTITAEEIHTSYVTSSVLYRSGSTKFGDTSDDNHNFTGSVYIEGNLNVDSITGSINFSNLTNVPTLVSASSQISYTGITDTPDGIVSGSSQIVDLGFLTTGSFETYTSSVDTAINNITLLTSSYVLNADTASMTVLSSSYAVTASYALSVLGGDGSEGRTAKMEQSVASTTWTFNHYLGERFPAITVFNSDGFVIIPTNVEAIDTNQLEVTFSSAQSGFITATVGGGLPTISGSYDGRVLAIDGSSPVWKENIVSGSLQIVNHGFTTTGSNSFNGNQTITGSLTIVNTKMGSLCTTSTGDTIVLDLGDFDGATIDYIVKYSSNRRFGTIMGVWDGAQYEYTETSTMDIGDTSDVTFNIDASGNLHAVSTLNTWEITLSYRALGC